MPKIRILILGYERPLMNLNETSRTRFNKKRFNNH